MFRSTLCKLACLSFLAGALPAATGCASAAPEASRHAGHHAIVVVGVGKVHAKPDIARIQIGIESRSATVEDANKQNTEQMSRLLAALKGAQIAESDLRTSNYSIHFERHDPGQGPMPMSAPAAAPPGGKKAAAPSAAATSAPAAAAPAGVYRVSNNVQVTVRDLARVGSVLDTAVATGANNVWGVSFELDNDASVNQKMREKAVADATQRATSLAKLGGVELGEIVSISEVVGGGRNGPMPMASFAKSGGTPIESGDLTFEGQIEVTYALKHR